jgi:hypothetical protein
MGEEKKNGVVENTDYYSARLFRSGVGRIFKNILNINFNFKNTPCFFKKIKLY